MMILLPALVTCVLIGLNLIALLNVFTFPRLSLEQHRRSQAGQARPEPFVSLLIPARNEAESIGDTVRRILAQDYPRFELIVLDDQSTDGTAQAAQAAGGGDARFRLLAGEPLPKGWLGKNWACHQLARAARGELLVFTDADVCWEVSALRALVHLAYDLRADLLTVWPTQHTYTWGERLTVPLMALTIVGYLPLLAVHYIPWPVFAAANGQCLLFRRAAYERIGGHAAVKGIIIEDIIMGKRIKACGLNLRMCDGAGVISCRMYNGWPSARDGYAKNILAGHGGRVSFLLLSSVFHWLVFLFPWFWLALGWLNPAWPGVPFAAWPLWPLGLVLLGISVRAITAAFTRQRVGDSLLIPISTLLMTLIAARAIWWQWHYGGPRWKGRTLALKDL